MNYIASVFSATKVNLSVPSGRLKASKDAITLWSDRLRIAVDYGLEVCLRVPEMPIVNNGKGSPNVSSFKTAWGRLQRKGLCERFTFHDLKAMGVSNFKGDKQAAGGWHDANMIGVYDRTKLKADATE